MRASTELNTNDGITRWSKWNKGSRADALRILGPSLQAVCLDAGCPKERAMEWLQSQSPEAITEDSIREFVRSVEAPQAEFLVAARERLAMIDREIAQQKPLTARDKVLLERDKPLSERSRDSILAELFEARTGCIRGAVEGGYAERGAKLPGIVWAGLQEREQTLQDELDTRDLRTHGMEHKPQQTRSDLDYIAPMRG